MDWSHQRGFIVFTNDLDFGAILAATRAQAPSVIQMRARDVLPEAQAEAVTNAIRQLHDELARGCLISIDETRSRVRILPLA